MKIHSSQPKRRSFTKTTIRERNESKTKYVHACMKRTTDECDQFEIEYSLFAELNLILQGK
jgi:hypothetical protein